MSGSLLIFTNYFQDFDLLNLWVLANLRPAYCMALSCAVSRFTAPGHGCSIVQDETQGPLNHFCSSSMVHTSVVYKATQRSWFIPLSQWGWVLTINGH